MSEWQPIATAPKDGTAILVCQTTPGDYEKQLSIARWRIIPERDVWVVVDEDTSKRKRIEASGWWADCGGMFPTHWMPLPDPPK